MMVLKLVFPGLLRKMKPLAVPVVAAGSPPQRTRE